MKKINITDYIKKSGETLRLTDAERARMQHTLSEYMSVKPIRANLAARRTPITTAWLTVYAFSRKSVAWALLFAVLFSGAGVSYAAEGAVPGDILYPLKVEVSEPIQGALTVSAEAKASWNAVLAERRLEEAEKLASENKLSDDKKAELVARFDQHAEAATNGIQTLEDSGSSSAIGIASDFETALAAHVTVLGDIDRNGKTDAVKSRVREKALAVSKVREKAEENALVSAPSLGPVAVATTFALQAPAPSFAAQSRVAVPAPSSQEKHADETRGVRKEVAEKMGASAKAALQTTQKIFTRVTQRLDEKNIADVAAQIANQAALIQTGDTQLSAGDYASAFRAYQEALVASGKLSVYLKALIKLKIKVLPSEHQMPAPTTEMSQGQGDAETVVPTDTNAQTESNLLPPIQILPPQNSDDGSGEKISGDGSDSVSGSGDESLRDKFREEVKVRLGL